MYQFYAEPMVMFINSHDHLLVNISILLRLSSQKELMLYSFDTVPMLFDTETLDGKNNEYTFINSYPYMSLNEHNYIPLTEAQLRLDTFLQQTAISLSESDCKVKLHSRVCQAVMYHCLGIEIGCQWLHMLTVW